MNLTKDDFARLHLRTREVDLTDVWPDVPPGEKVTALVREMSGRDRGLMQEQITELHPGGRVSLKQRDQLAIVAALCLVDENGERLYSTSEAPSLSQQWPATVLARISEVALELSGIGPDAEAETEGNSDAAPSGEPSSF